MLRSRQARFAAGLVLAFAAGGATAKGKLQTRPTLVELPPRAAASRFVMANSGDSSVAAQVRVFAWSQEGGEDKLTPTDEVAISPPIAQIAAGAEQVVRVIRQAGPAVGADRTYRLVVDELPADKADDKSTIAVRLRYVIPLFVRAAGAEPPDLTCRLGAATLSCRNKGGQAAQLGRTRLSDTKGHSVELNAGLFGYVLPLSERRWELVAGTLATLVGELRLESQVNGQPATIPVERAL